MNGTHGPITINTTQWEEKWKEKICHSNTHLYYVFFILFRKNHVLRTRYKQSQIQKHTVNKDRRTHSIGYAALSHRWSLTISIDPSVLVCTSCLFSLCNIAVCKDSIGASTPYNICPTEERHHPCFKISVLHSTKSLDERQTNITHHHCFSLFKDICCLGLDGTSGAYGVNAVAKGNVQWLSKSHWDV